MPWVYEYRHDEHVENDKINNENVNSEIIMHMDLMNEMENDENNCINRKW